MVPRDPIADVRRRLGRAPRPPAKLRAIIRAWWGDHGFADLPASVGKRVALALLERRAVEDQLTGIIVLQQPLGEQLRASDLASFARLFTRPHLDDAMVVDMFATNVLGTLLARETGRGDVIRGLAQWRSASTKWQRRAACLALATLAPRGDSVHGLTDAILLVCATVVWSREEEDQAAVGVVLRELSRAEPLCVEAFFRRYARFMSRACARAVVSKLAPGQRTELLAHHRRATSIR